MSKSLFFLTCIDLQGALPSRSHWIVRHLAAGQPLSVGSMRVVAPSLGGPIGRVRHWFSPYRLQRFEYAGASVTCVETPVGPLSRLGAFGSMRAIEALERSVLAYDCHFDVCIAEEPWSAIAALRLRDRGVFGRVLFDDVDRFAEFMAPSRRISRALTERLESRSILGADAVVAVSCELVKRSRELGVEAEWIPNGVNWEAFRPPDVMPPEYSCVYVGNLQTWTGVVEAALAVGSLIDAGLPATFRIYGFGSPDYERQLREAIDSGGWSASIELCGRVEPDDLPSALAGARVGLVTREPGELAAHMFPIKIPEYWAAGLGVVGTDIGEIGRVLREGPCGMATAFDPPAIAGAIRAVSDSMTLAGMARTREAARQYAWSSLVPRLQQRATGEARAKQRVGAIQ